MKLFTKGAALLAATVLFALPAAAQQKPYEP